MKNRWIFTLVLLAVVLGASTLDAESYVPTAYAPPVGQEGSTAIYYDDPAFVAWACGIELIRGPMDIQDPDGGLASYGVPESALGKSNGGSVVSLGDGGSATLTFGQPIFNGDGWDFAVFENGFNNTFLELAFVEVSSDGENFFRFAAVSNTPCDTQVGGCGLLDATNLNNLAGKYRANYGTPFDLQELAGTSGLDVNNVTHVRVIDVVGCIEDGYCTYDSLGNKVNDPYPTPFASGGFDLACVGVIHAVPEPGVIVLLIGLAAMGIVRTPKKRLTPFRE